MTVPPSSMWSPNVRSCRCRRRSPSSRPRASPSTPSALCSRARATSPSPLPGRTSVGCSEPEYGGSGSASSRIRPQETCTAQYRLTQPSQSRTVVAIGHFRASEVSDRDHCSAPVSEGDHCSAAGVARRSDHWVVRQRLGGDEGGGHGLVPLVLLRAFESGPVESLLFGVAGEHAEAH